MKTIQVTECKYTCIDTFIYFSRAETNSGAHNFDWNIDHDVFYKMHDNLTVNVRWKNGEIIIENRGIMNNNAQIDTINIDIHDYEKIYDSNMTSVFTNEYVYIANDTVMCLFDNNLNYLNACRYGNYRFCDMHLCIDNSIYVNKQSYYPNLIPKRFMSNYIVNKTIKTYNVRYGLTLKHKVTGEIVYARMTDCCELVFTK